MSSATSYLQSIAAHQEQVVHLQAGTELRCVSGSLDLRLVFAGTDHSLRAGQAMRLSDDQYVRIASNDAARYSLETEPVQPGQAEKNRQGLDGLWRSLAARLMVRRGPRAA